MKKILFSVIASTALGFSFYSLVDGFVIKVPKIEIPAGQVYCRFVPSSHEHK
jgi:hypothetical protein